MLPTLLTDSLTITPQGSQDVPDGQGGVVRATAPGGASFTVPGRVEVWKHRNTGHISGEGDVIDVTHIAYLPPATYNDDGSVDSVVRVGLDAHVRDQAGNDYLVVGVSSQARRREGDVDHLEVQLRLTPGV